MAISENLKKSIASILSKSKSDKKDKDDVEGTLESKTVEKFDLAKSLEKVNRISHILAKAGPKPPPKPPGAYNPKQPYPGESTSDKGFVELPKPFRLDETKPAHYSDSKNLQTFRKLHAAKGDSVYDDFSYDPKSDKISSISKQGKNTVSAAVKTHGSPTTPKVGQPATTKPPAIKTAKEPLKQSLTKTDCSVTKVREHLKKTAYNKKIAARAQEIKDSQVKPESNQDIENRVRNKYIKKPYKSYTPPEDLKKEWSLDGIVEGAREMVGRPASGGMTEGDSTGGDTSNSDPRGEL